MAVAPGTRAETPAQDAPLCVEMIHRDLPYSVIVEYEENGMVKRTGYKGGSCDKLGEKIGLEWADYLGLFPIKLKGYYPRKVREPDITWFWTETLNEYESSDRRELFDSLRISRQVEVRISSTYSSEAFVCYGSGEPCEHETEGDIYDYGPINFEISKREILSIGGKDYEVWIIDWSSGKIIYSPLLKIPLKDYAYRSVLKDPELYLVAEVVEIHRSIEVPSSERD